MQSEILARVIRGETIESIHRGHLIVVDGDGRTLVSLGNAETVAKMLGKVGLDEPDLRCGAQMPFNEEIAEKMIRADEKPTQLHNNCSGKHATMLALAKHLNADLQSYEDLENPVQQAILEAVSLFTDVPRDEIKIGIDGCAAPNFALPLRAMALSFARLVFPPQSFDTETRKACRRIVSAMISYPEMIGGTERLDTILMQATRGRIISKVGAEGVYVAGILPCESWKRGLGIAVKIEDGDDKRARAVVIIELLRALGVLDITNDEKLREYSPMPIKNRRGDTVGKVVANLDLKLHD